MSWLYSNRSWRTRVGKSGAYHKSESRRRKGEERSVGTRDRGSRRGHWKRRGEGESGEQAGPLPTPIYSAVVMLYILGNVSRCPGIVLVERPRRDVSDLQQLQIPSEHQAQHFFLYYSKLSLQK